MVMTPQLLQAIKLLQLPNIELAAYIENELERNPLLERAEDFSPSETGSEPAALFEAPALPEGEADWASQELETDASALAQNLGTELDNAFEPDRAPAPAEFCATPEGHGLSATSWSGVSGGAFSCGRLRDCRITLRVSWRRRSRNQLRNCAMR